MATLLEIHALLLCIGNMLDGVALRLVWSDSSHSGRNSFFILGVAKLCLTKGQANFNYLKL